MADKFKTRKPLVPISTSCPFVCWYIIFIFFYFLTFCVASYPSSSAINTPLAPSPNDVLKPPFQTRARRLNSRTVIALITVSGFLLFCFFLSLMGFSLFKFLKLKKSKRSRPTSQVVDHESNREVAGSDVDGDGDLSVRKYSWSEIERVTLNFSKVIGYGGFSNVYLGQFFRGSKQGAVKIHIGSDRLNQVFKQELDILLRLSHVNIVKLLGYCDEREEGALVFEYIPNGNLQEKLHGSSRNYSELPWRNRMAIAFQLTKAIEYLHEKCSLQIVHGDIKASNILLDENLNCKLCDFGSAKMGFSSMVQPPSSSPSPGRAKQVMMIGSPGYTDPHYLKSGIASKKNDIYSLGVIILELVTGKEAFNPEREESLAMAAAPMLREIGEGGGDVEKIKVAEYIDPRLMGEFDLEEAKTMLFISGLCLRQSPTLRPSATQILQSMKEKVSSINFLFPEPHKG